MNEETEVTYNINNIKTDKNYSMPEQQMTMMTPLDNATDTIGAKKMMRWASLVKETQLQSA